MAEHMVCVVATQGCECATVCVIPASLAALLAGMTPEQLEVLGKALTGVDPQEAADLLDCWKHRRPDESLMIQEHIFAPGTFQAYVSPSHWDIMGPRPIRAIGEGGSFSGAIHALAERLREGKAP